METRTLINSIKKMYPVVNFLKDRYFPDGKRYYSEKALIETKSKGRQVAPFVVPIVNGIAIEKEGYQAYQVDAPYIAPKKTITPSDIEKKAFGESPESGRSPEERQNEVRSEYLDDLRISINRRLEQMAGEVITTGALCMKHYATADDAANDKNAVVKELRFYNGSFGNVFEFDVKFSKLSARGQMEALYDMAGELFDRGISATDLVVTRDVAKMLLTNPEFLKYFDVRRANFGEISPEKLPDGIVINGTIIVNGVALTMFTYDNKYQDLDGQVKSIFPAGTIALLTPGMGTTVYAQVTLVKGDGFVSYAERIAAREVASETNNTVEVQEFSRPIPYPLDWDGWLIANAYQGEDPSGGDDDPEVAKLSTLTLGSLTLSPTFDADTTTYTTTTTNDTNAVTATAAEGITVTIKVNGSDHTSGESATWTEGENTVVVTASGTGMTTTTYTVTVTKS